MAFIYNIWPIGEMDFYSLRYYKILAGKSKSHKGFVS